MNHQHRPDGTVFDPHAVESLTGDAHDAEFALVFVDKFRTLLPQRVRRLAISLGAGEVDDALDAVRSLRASACLVGAAELCQIGHTIEVHLRRTDLLRARLALAGLAAAADRADAALGAYLAA